MKILYIVVGTLHAEATSGSSRRPNCMYDAFLERGHTVYALHGFEGRGEGQQRKAAIKQAMQWVEDNHPDLCYIESSTYPLIHFCDYAFLYYLRRKKIPIGYFYRDFYRKFPELLPKRKGIVNKIKDIYLDVCQWCTDKILEIVDIVYFPSEESTQLFGYKNKKVLPPAGFNCLSEKTAGTYTLIYVGGILGHYGFDILMDTFQLLNRNENKYHLILVCRENEWNQVGSAYNALPWLEVHHASGDDLKPLYNAASAALMVPKSDNPYNKLAVSVKLFEYMSFGLPIVATKSDAMDTIIQKYNLGMSVPYQPERLADAIRTLLDDPQLYNVFTDNVKDALLKENLWVHRVDQIVKDLTE